MDDRTIVAIVIVAVVIAVVSILAIVLTPSNWGPSLIPPPHVQ